MNGKGVFSSLVLSQTDFETTWNEMGGVTCVYNLLYFAVADLIDLGQTEVIDRVRVHMSNPGPFQYLISQPHPKKALALAFSRLLPPYNRTKHSVSLFIEQLIIMATRHNNIPICESDDLAFRLSMIPNYNA